MNNDNKELVRLPYFDWDKAKDFYYVAKLGSFSEAGKFLNISQSSLSRKIKILEDHLNFKVFTRLPHGLELTRKGEELFKIIENTFLELRGLTYNPAVMGDNGQKRKIRISTTQPVAAYILNEYLIIYNQSNPHIIFEIIVDDHMIDLVVNDVDIAIRPHDIKTNNLEQEPLFILKKQLFVSHAYISKYGEPKEVSELNNHYFVTYAQPEKHPYSDIRWSLGLGMPPNEFREPIYTSNSMECLVDVTKKGMGIFASFEKMSIIRDAKLKVILPEIYDTPVKWYYTYSKCFKNDSEIKKLGNFLKENLL